MAIYQLDALLKRRRGDGLLRLERAEGAYQRSEHIAQEEMAQTGQRRRAGALWRIWAQRARHRAMLRDELLQEPDSVLADAGLTREEAVQESKKPFWRA